MAALGLSALLVSADVTLVNMGQRANGEKQCRVAGPWALPAAQVRHSRFVRNFRWFQAGVGALRGQNGTRSVRAIT
jgi:hypothetical protein